MDSFDTDTPYDTPAEPVDTPAEPAAPAPDAYRPAYVRPAKPRRTVASIDDVDQDAFDARGNYTHDSNFSASGQNRIRQGDRLRRDSQYGQYLEVPKGKKTIFSSREQARQRRSAIVMAVIVAILVILLVVAVRLITGA